MSATGDGRADGPRTGFVSRMLLKAFGPAQITPADEDDRREQQSRSDGDPRPAGDGGRAG